MKICITDDLYYFLAMTLFCFIPSFAYLFSPSAPITTTLRLPVRIYEHIG